MASFSLENAHFSYPHPFNPQFENVPLKQMAEIFRAQV